MCGANTPGRWTPYLRCATVVAGIRLRRNSDARRIPETDPAGILTADLERPSLDARWVMGESDTICRHVVGEAGRGDLLPAAPRERAHVECWMDWRTRTSTIHGAMLSWRCNVARPATLIPASSDRVSMCGIARTGECVAGESFTCGPDLTCQGRAGIRLTSAPASSCQPGYAGSVSMAHTDSRSHQAAIAMTCGTWRTEK